MATKRVEQLEEKQLEEALKPLPVAEPKTVIKEVEKIVEKEVHHYHYHRNPAEAPLHEQAALRNMN